MLTLAFNFPTGRYHATPWGRHVNEADVSWPPDPWRLTRAMIATWHRKLDPVLFPRGRLTALLRLLASEPPLYWLPEAVHFHTRHYMPSRSKPTLIFDAFAQIDKQAELIAHWPNVTLTQDHIELLDALLAVIGYLGRAESWVISRRVTEWRGEFNCHPSEVATNPQTGEALGDLVPLLLPLSPELYAEARANHIAAFLARARAEIHQKRAEAIICQKKLPNLDEIIIPPQVSSTLPEDWLEAISLDTGELQAAGWSAPPAARQLYYLRTKDALRFMAARPAVSRPHKFRTVTTASFALYTKPLPLITNAVRVGEILRRAAMSAASDPVPTTLSGHDLPESNRHGHAFFLSESRFARNRHEGRIDHLIIHANDGLCPRAQAALANLKRIRTRDGIEWQLLLEGIGNTNDFSGISELFGAAACWRSLTPYLHPWHRKKSFGVAEQIVRECHLRSLPEPIAVKTLPQGKPRALDFYRFRSKRGLRQPDRQGSFVQIEFPEAISGPIALGFGCHFGLGMFGPILP